MTSEPQVVADGSISRLSHVLDETAARLAWDNDVRFHVSRHLLCLRRYRKMSQDRLAKVSGTSQSAIARIESGDGNITEATLERLIVALKGRFRVSIAPAELHIPEWPVWWEMLDAGASAPFTLTAAMVDDDGHTRRVGGGWESAGGTAIPLLEDGSAT